MLAVYGESNISWHVEMFQIRRRLLKDLQRIYGEYRATGVHILFAIDSPYAFSQSQTFQQSRHNNVTKSQKIHNKNRRKDGHVLYECETTEYGFTIIDVCHNEPALWDTTRNASEEVGSKTKV